MPLQIAVDFRGIRDERAEQAAALVDHDMLGRQHAIDQPFQMHDAAVADLALDEQIGADHRWLRNLLHA